MSLLEVFQDVVMHYEVWEHMSLPPLEEREHKRRFVKQMLNINQRSDFGFV